MLNKLRLPPYFTQSLRHQIADLYASVAIADFALAIVTIFEPIFLYSVLHLSIPIILLLNALTYAVYIPCIIFGGKIASKFGYAHSILFSIPLQILFWVFLYAGQETRGFLPIAFIIYGMEKALYWPAFHSSVARFAQDQQRGREFSVLYAIVNLVAIIGPFVGGFLSQNFGIRMAFVVASAVYACSFIPLFSSKEIFVPKPYNYNDTLALYKALPKKSLGYMGFAEEMILMNVWPIFIFVVVAGYEKVGGLVTVATLVAAGLSLYIGKVTDASSKISLLKFGTLFYFFIWLFRLIAITPYTVFAADSLSRTGKEMNFIPLSTLTYERAAAGHIMPYIIFFEQSLSIGKLASALLGAWLFWMTTGMFHFSLHTGFMVLFVQAGLFSLLYMLI